MHTEPIRLDWIDANEDVRWKIGNKQHGYISLSDIREAVCHGQADKITMEVQRDGRRKVSAWGRTYDGRRIVAHLYEDHDENDFWWVASSWRIDT